MSDFTDRYAANDKAEPAKEATTSGLVSDWLGSAYRAANDTVLGRTATGALAERITDMVASRLADKLGLDADKVKPVMSLLKVALKEIQNVKSMTVTDDNGRPRVEIERSAPSEVQAGLTKVRFAEKIAFTVAPSTKGVSFSRIEGISVPVANRSIGLKEADIAMKDGKIEVTAKSNLAFVPPVKLTFAPPTGAVKKVLSGVR